MLKLTGMKEKLLQKLISLLSAFFLQSLKLAKANFKKLDSAGWQPTFQSTTTLEFRQARQIDWASCCIAKDEEPPIVKATSRAFLAKHHVSQVTQS